MKTIRVQLSLFAVLLAVIAAGFVYRSVEKAEQQRASERRYETLIGQFAERKGQLDRLQKSVDDLRAQINRPPERWPATQP